MIMGHICGQISYNCCLSIAFKLQIGYNSKHFSVQIQRAAAKEIAHCVIRLAKLIPASHVKAESVQLLIIIHKLWMILKRVEVRRERRMEGNRMMHVII